jgi:hypothetical protein
MDEEYSIGYIKLFRKLLNHWLNSKEPKTRLEAWIIILLSVNYDSKKVLINGQLFECGRGQSLKSLKTWANEFNWSIQNVRSFFKLLKKDNMITIENLIKTTRLTVCNWEKYQARLTDNQQFTNTDLTNKSNDGNTQLTSIKEDEKLTNEINIIELARSFLLLIIKNQDVAEKEINFTKDFLKDFVHKGKIKGDQLHKLLNWLQERKTTQSRYWRKNLKDSLHFKNSIIRMINAMESESKPKENQSLTLPLDTKELNDRISNYRKNKFKNG